MPQIRRSDSNIQANERASTFLLLPSVTEYLFL